MKRPTTTPVIDGPIHSPYVSSTYFLTYILEHYLFDSSSYALDALAGAIVTLNCNYVFNSSSYALDALAGAIVTLNCNWLIRQLFICAGCTRRCNSDFELQLVDSTALHMRWMHSPVLLPCFHPSCYVLSCVLVPAPPVFMYGGSLIGCWRLYRLSIISGNMQSS